MRRTGLVVGAVLLLAAVGWWGWFLAEKPISEADSWSSVLSGFVGLAGLALAVWGGRGGSRQVRRIRTRNVTDSVLNQGDTGVRTKSDQEDRSIRTRDVSGSVLNQGDDFRHRP